MNDNNRTPAGGVVAPCDDETSCKPMACEVCLAEVPADAINHTDAQDYVHHFCGLGCLEAWQRRAGKHDKGPA